MNIKDLTPGKRVYVRLSNGKKSGTVGSMYEAGKPCQIIRFDSGEMGKITAENCRFFFPESELLN
jgi:hypothetical protein